VAVRVIFKTKISRARKTISGLNAQDMKFIGEKVLGTIQDRIGAAKDIHDHDAHPLKPKYAKFKMKYGAFPIRNLFLTGRTFRGMKVTRVDQNKAVLDIIDPVAAFRVSMNRRRVMQWGLSPSDRKRFSELVLMKWREKQQRTEKTTTTKVA
jgi:hypothetical protein